MSSSLSLRGRLGEPPRFTRGRLRNPRQGTTFRQFLLLSFFLHSTIFLFFSLTWPNFSSKKIIWLNLQKIAVKNFPLQEKESVRRVPESRETSGVISADYTPAQILDKPVLFYPEAAIVKKETGQVLVVVELSSEGRPLKTEIYQSSGFSELDQAALNQALAWQYQPAEFLGKPIPCKLVVPVKFELR